MTAGYCPKTGKRGWYSKSEAKRAMKAVNGVYARHSGVRKLTGVYRCGCGMWHTTSRGSH